MEQTSCCLENSFSSQKNLTVSHTGCPNLYNAHEWFPCLRVDSENLLKIGFIEREKFQNHVNCS